jgi:hypothetical protein
MPTVTQRILGKLQSLVPREAFFFNRPLLLLQSDDWGRAGLRDQEGFDQLRSAGLALGERPYDLYTLETSNDLTALSDLLKRHRDPTGRPAVCGMNFITANPDLPKMVAAGSSKIQLLPLADGLPAGWARPGLMEACKDGIAAGVLYPALHGTTHFCRPAVERHAGEDSDRGKLIRTLWAAGTPYIHWRMPWIGYEYCDPEPPDSDSFLTLKQQLDVIGTAVGLFARLFSTVPRSACAPGYRANSDTARAWSQYGIRCAQNGPGKLVPPHHDRHSVLHLYRAIEFEPAVDPGFSLDASIQRAHECFKAGVPAIVSMHSINFHSTVRDYRTRSLDLLDQFLSALESLHPEMLYVHDEDLLRLVETGTYEGLSPRAPVSVTKRIWRPQNSKQEPAVAEEQR